VARRGTAARQTKKTTIETTNYVDVETNNGAAGGSAEAGKARCMANNDKDNVLIPPTTRTRTMTTMTTSCKSLPFFIGFLLFG
jgi:hypothetical protein